jgi:sortase A
MASYYYKKGTKKLKRLYKALSLLIFLCGIGIIFYVFFPLISWQVYFAPVFASQNVEVPIPKYTVVGPGNFGSLLTSAASAWATDYTNAGNWYPSYLEAKNAPQISNYTVSIPKINIESAKISTMGRDLASYMVQINTGTTPPQKGNAVVYGHSTLPQLFNPKDYKTILANAYKLEVGDDIIVNASDKNYKYKVISVRVVEPEDTSVLAQDFSGRYLTFITCTPPGTTWKRLIIKSALVSGE